jgi:hypothetical protein
VLKEEHQEKDDGTPSRHQSRSRKRHIRQ